MNVNRKITFCKIYFFLFFLPFIVAGCFRPSIGPCQFGNVKDSVHNLPLQNVAVLMGVGYDCFNPLCFPAGSCSYSLPDRKRYTDDEGKFFFAPQIHMAEHWICWSTKNIEYSKPGYCTLGDTDSWFYKNVHLDPWTHSLDSLYYSEQLRYSLPLTSDQLDRLGFVAGAEKGVFYRRPGSCFTKIFRDNSFFDETSNGWITLDNRGKEFVPRIKPPGDPEKFISKCGRLFTDGEKIFIRNLKNEVETIIPHKGDISYVFHDSPGCDFYTIEGDGSMICHYGIPMCIYHLYNTEPETKSDDICFFKAYDSSALSTHPIEMERSPDSSMDWKINYPSLDHIKFLKIKKLNSRGFLLLTKTQLNWHIYQMEWRYKNNTKKHQLEFTELACFPTKREILAFTSQDNSSLFISFKNEGIRKFKIENGQLIENKKFYERSHLVITADILEISPDYLYVYAVSGEDKIYRFSYDGWPDYPIQLKPGIKQALDVPHNFLYKVPIQIKYTTEVENSDF